MTTPTPDPFGSRPHSTSDDSPTTPVDLPPPGPGAATAPEPPTPAQPLTPAQPPSAAGSPPAAPWPGSIPPRPAEPAVSSRPSAAPQANTQPGLVIGIVLVIVGAVLLLTRVTDITFGPNAWPLWIVVPGVAMLLGSLAVPPRGGLGLAVPGSIIATVGLILWVQDTYDAYATWAYAWALVAPTAPGVGTLLYATAKGDRELAGDGLRTTLVGLALFAGFALFFEGVIGLSGEPIANLDEVLPYGVIGLGILMVVLSLFGGGRRPGTRST